MDYNNKSASSKDSAGEVGNQPTVFLERHHHITRSVVIIINLLIFLAILPPQIRNALFHGILLHRFLTGMLLIFCLISLSLLWSAGQQLDAGIFLYFNLRWESPYWLDKIMLGFTQLGNGFVGFLIALFLFFVDNHHLAYELIVGTLSLWLVVEATKAIIHRSRPYKKLFQTRIVGSRPKGKSFPSGHTSQAFFTATLLVQHFHVNLWIAMLLYTLAVFVGVTRMYVGAHYPRDVMAGAILGSVWGALGVMVDIHFIDGIIGKI